MILTWLGQSGFLLESEIAPTTSILIDAWLSPHPERAASPPALNALPGRLDLVLATHGHEDHLDMRGLIALARTANLGALVVPTPHLPRAQAMLTSTAVVGVQPGDRIDMPRIRVVRAWHGQVVGDGYTDGLADQSPTPHVGYVIEVDHVRVYHAGDSLAAPELAAEVRALRPDVAVLPVNGRDPIREAAGILGNMSGEEAVAFATDVGARALVPMHYDGVRGNTTDPAEVCAAAHHADLEVLVADRESRVPIRLR